MRHTNWVGGAAMKCCNTLIGPAVSPEDYETEIARRMWCAAVSHTDEVVVDELKASDVETIKELRRVEQ